MKWTTPLTEALGGPGEKTARAMEELERRISEIQAEEAQRLLDEQADELIEEATSG